MIKTAVITLSMLALCVAATPAQQAQERKGSALSSWLQDLQKKIDALSPRLMPTVTRSAAGARGTRDDGAGTKLYWKGRGEEEAVTGEELKAFREGLAAVEAGRGAEAVHAFEAFMARYPDSALIPDAKKTLDLMKAEAAAGPRPDGAASATK